MKYPNRIKEHRDARGLAQWVVAQAVSVSPERLGRLEKGMAQPTYEEAKRFGEAFGVHPDSLFAPVTPVALPRAS